MRITAIAMLLVTMLAAGCKENNSPLQPMRGVVLNVVDLGTVDWPRLAHENGINTIGTHVNPGEVLEFIRSERGQVFIEECRKYGICVEHQLHAMSELLPREMFTEDPSMFRMNSEGVRSQDSNCCVHSEKALETIASNAAEFARLLPADNHRYYFWLDDGKETCQCPECSQFTASEQALIIENRMIKAIREVDPEARLAHLAYANTLSAPEKVKPAEGIFLEFAPFFRTWSKPLADTSATSGNINFPMTHGDNLRHLENNLKVFTAKDAVVLEYWLDVSLFSGWTKPAVRLPWNREVFRSDIDTYRSYGLNNFTSFAVYMDSSYFSRFPQTDCLKEYGNGLRED